MIPNNKENEELNEGPNCSDNSTDTFTLVFPLIPCLSDADADGDGGCLIVSEDNIYDVDLKRKFKSGTNEQNDVINFELRRLTMPYWMNGYEDEDGNEEDKITFKQTYYDIVYMQTQFNKFEVLLYLLIQTFLLTASAEAQNKLASTKVFVGTKVFAGTGENFISFLTNEINTYLLAPRVIERLRQELEEAEKALDAADGTVSVDAADGLARLRRQVAAKQKKFDAAEEEKEINIGVSSLLYTDIKDLTDNDESYKQLSDSETEFRNKTMPERIKIIRESTDAEVNENNLEEEEESYFNEKKKDIIITILIDIKINNIIDLINGENDEEQKKKIFKILIDGNDNMIDIHTRSQSEDLIYLLQMCNYDEMIEYIKTAPPPSTTSTSTTTTAGGGADGFVGYNNFEGFTSLNMFTPLIEGNVNNNPEPENLEQTLTSKLETETKPKINLTKLIESFIKISDNETGDEIKYKKLDKEEMNKRRKQLWETTNPVEKTQYTYDDNGYLKVIEINNSNPHEKEKSEKGKTILDITDEYKKYVNDCELTEFLNLKLLDTAYQFHISIMENINVNKKNEIKEAIKTEITELDPNGDKFDGEKLTDDGTVRVFELKEKKDALNTAIEKEKTSKVDLEDADAGTKGQKQIDYNTANEELKTAIENLDEVSTQLTLLLERYNNLGSINTELENWYNNNKEENYCKWLVLFSYLLMNDHIKIDTSTNVIIKEEKYDDNVIDKLKIKLEFVKEGFTGSNNYEGFTSLNMFNSHKEGFDLLENNDKVFTKFKFIDVNNYKIDNGGEGGGEGGEGGEGGGEGGGAKVPNPTLFPIQHQFERFRQSIMDDIENTNFVDVSELPNKWVPTYSNMEIKNYHIGIVRIMDYIKMFSNGIETNFSAKEGFIGSQKKLDNNTLRDIEKNIWKEWDNTEFSGNLRLKELWGLIVEKNKSKALMLNNIDINDNSGINCLGHMSGIIIFPYVKYKETKNGKIIEFIFPDDRKNVREYVNKKNLIIESFSDFKDKFVQTCDGGFQYNDIKGNSVELDLIKDAEDIIFIY